MSKTPSTGIRTHARGFATTSSLTLVELSSAGFDGRTLSPHVMKFASRFNRQPSRSDAAPQSFEQLRNSSGRRFDPWWRSPPASRAGAHPPLPTSLPKSQPHLVRHSAGFVQHVGPAVAQRRPPEGEHGAVVPESVSYCIMKLSAIELHHQPVIGIGAIEPSPCKPLVLTNHGR